MSELGRMVEIVFVKEGTEKMTFKFKGRDDIAVYAWDRMGNVVVIPWSSILYLTLLP